jgi:hypothetical protein
MSDQVQCKDGVSLHGLHYKMRIALKKADSIWRLHGQELVVTSACDGKHSKWSWHYFGCAVDLRTNYFESGTEIVVVAEKLRRALGPGYEVVVHHGSHMHVEYDPNTVEY